MKKFALLIVLAILVVPAIAWAVPQVDGVNIIDGSVTGADIRDDSVTGVDVDEGTLTLPEGPAGPQGEQGPKGEPGPAGPAGSGAVSGHQIVHVRKTQFWSPNYPRPDVTVRAPCPPGKVVTGGFAKSNHDQTDFGSAAWSPKESVFQHGWQATYSAPNISYVIELVADVYAICVDGVPPEPVPAFYLADPNNLDYPLRNGSDLFWWNRSAVGTLATPEVALVDPNPRDCMAPTIRNSPPPPPGSGDGLAYVVHRTEELSDKTVHYARYEIFPSSSTTLPIWASCGSGNPIQIVVKLNP